MDKQSEAKESSFPYDGIFSPHGFLSTISSSSSEDPGGNSSAIKVDGECEDQVHGQLTPKKKLKKQANCNSGTKVVQNIDFPPREVAFAMDHILEKILHPLGTADLFKCRVVCLRWCIVATAELQKTLELSFEDDFLQMEARKPEFKLHHLTRLLKQKPEVGRSRFPCQKYKFDATKNTRNKGNVCSSQLKQFLDVYGVHIRSLCIDDWPAVTDESVALAKIRELLTEKTPNLKNFSLSLDICKENSAELGSKNEEVSKIKSLKTLHMHTSWRDSLKVLECVLQMAPNLEELVHDDGGVPGSSNTPFGGGNYRYICFTKPLNRLHLLKEVHLGSIPHSIESLEKIVRASLDNPGTLKLRRFRSFTCGLRELPRTEFGFEFGWEKRFVAVMNHLLDSSWDTLETFTWKNVTFLEGLKWRKVMSQVKTLRLGLFKGSDLSAGRHDVKLFSPGLRLSTIFPKLRSLEIHYDCTESESQLLMRFLKHLNPEEEVLNSVTDVRVGDPFHTFTASAEVLKLLREFFPKAEIQYPYPCLQFL